MSLAELEELLKLDEVAKILKLDEGTIESWRYGPDPHRLPFVKLGNSPRSPVRYRKADVLEFIAKYRLSNEPEKPVINVPVRRTRRTRRVR